MMLVERDRELGLLHELFDDARLGQGWAVLVTGAPAIGKTALLRAFAARALTAGALHLGATAARAERSRPLAVMRQLIGGSALPDDVPARARRLLDEGAYSCVAYADDDGPGAAADLVPAPILHGLCMTLLDLADDRPLVVTVDDLHHADAPSLQCLLYLVRRLRTARLVVVFGRDPHPRLPHPTFDAELLRQPRCRVLPLHPLTSTGVRQLLTRHLDDETSDRLAPEAYAVSGGNPLLVLGLMADGRGAPRPLERVVVGSSFSRALIGCLYRSDASLLRLVRGLAVLGESDLSGVLPRLVDLPAKTVGVAIDALTATGILADGWFRHPVARAAGLDAMLPEERTALHARAAVALQEAGAPTTEVAPHLLAAGHVAEPWTIAVLRDAAEQALADGGVDAAIGYLQLIANAATGEGERTVAKVTLGSARWRVNPSLAARNLPELMAAIRAGQLTAPEALAPVHWLLWFGRNDEALEMLRYVTDAGPAPDTDTTDAIHSAEAWLRVCHPSLLGSTEAAGTGAAGTGARTRGAANLKVQSACLLREAITDGASDHLLTMTEQILLGNRLTDRTLEPICTALAALVHADELEAAGRWCEPLLVEAGRLHATTWQALFTAIRAEIAFRQGDLPAAERHAGRALTLLAPRDWGIVAGLPLGTLLRTCAAAGRFEEALVHLRVPVPGAILRSPVGVHYLGGRGAYLHATGRYAAALADFQSCGTLLSAWAVESGVMVPWRIDAALSCLRLGRPGEARELIRQQRRRLSDGHVRVQGMTLRVSAAVSDPPQRPALLQRAVAQLRRCGDQLELAYATADLGRARLALGEPAAAMAQLCQAERLAARCGAEPLQLALSEEIAGVESSGRPDPAARPLALARLSDAERRVTVLAARGRTNRQIADELHLTVSTIEQHLTRVYRKLGLKHRRELASRLDPETVEPE